METPELEFLLYLLTEYLRKNDMDAKSATVSDLMASINVNLTPIGGG